MKKLLERLLDLLGLVHLALSQAALQFLHGDIDVDDFVGAIEERVGNGLPHTDAGHAPDGIVERLEVLDVDRGQHADARVEQFQDVLIALVVPAAGHVGMGELVDDAELRSSLQDRVEVHLLEHDAAIFDVAPGDDLQVADLGVGVGATVGLDEAHDDIDALASERVRILRASSRSSRRQAPPRCRCGAGRAGRPGASRAPVRRSGGSLSGIAPCYRAAYPRLLQSLRTLYDFLLGLRTLYGLLSAFLREVARTMVEKDGRRGDHEHDRCSQSDFVRGARIVGAFWY